MEGLGMSVEEIGSDGILLEIGDWGFFLSTSVGRESVICYFECERSEHC